MTNGQMKNRQLNKHKHTDRYKDNRETEGYTDRKKSS